MGADKEIDRSSVSGRTLKRLQRNGITTWDSLARYSPTDLLGMGVCLNDMHSLKSGLGRHFEPNLLALKGWTKESIKKLCSL